MNLLEEQERQQKEKREVACHFFTRSFLLFLCVLCVLCGEFFFSSEGLTMAQAARQVVEVRDFPGLATRPDSLDVPPGAAVRQDNVQSSHEGKLRSRQPLGLLDFEED